MGGINHQPCKHYLAQSTRMSRAMSMTGIALEVLNVKLEDIILSNLNGETVDLDMLLSSAQSLSDNAERGDLAIAALISQMDELYYVDLPVASSFNHALFGKKAVAKAMVTQYGFDEIAEKYISGGFRAAISHLRTCHSDFHRSVVQMHRQIEDLKRLDISDIAFEFESNGTGNIRPQFAKMYTSWDRFRQMFLASSLISTEIFYISESCGSLLGEKIPVPFL